jgi:hypothetical protein
VVGLSNARVAALLEAPVVIVSEGGVGRPIDEIVLNHALFERDGVRVVGAVVNKVDVESHPDLPDILRRGLAQHGIDLLGCIPYSDLLANPSLELIATHLDGELLAGQATPGRTIGHVAIGAMQAKHAAGFIRDRTLLITPGDRDDMIAMALELNAGAEGQVTGIVLIKVNGKFVPLKGFKQVPLGTELDTTKGKVKLTSPDGSTAFFYEGRFIILGGMDTPGPGKSKKLVVIRLTGGNFDACGTRGTAGFSAKPKPKGKPIRHAWGNAKGSFRTKGRYASATVRGTLWRTDDYCNGTLITVLRGKVDVLDLVLHKHSLISAGHTYFAPS